MVDRLKSRLKEKEVEIEKVTKASELLKHGLERYDFVAYNLPQSVLILNVVCVLLPEPIRTRKFLSPN